MVEIVDFADAKLPHARKRRDEKARDIKKAFAAARSAALPKPTKSRKNGKKKKKQHRILDRAKQASDTPQNS